MAPVSVRYEDEDGEKQQRTFWLVALKTVSNYNFADHIASLLQEIDAGSKGLKRKVHNGEIERVQELIYDVLLHQYRISPSIETLIDRQKAVKVTIFQKCAKSVMPCKGRTLLLVQCQEHA